MSQNARAGVYFCRQPARCVAPVPGGDTGWHRFAVGTLALKEPNGIHIVDFSEDTSEVVCKCVLPHEDEVWMLNVSPADAGNILTYTSGQAKPALRLWRTNDQDTQEPTLQLMSSLAEDDTQLMAVKSMLWDPHHEGNIVVADTEAIHVFQATASSNRLSRQLMLQVGQRCSGACIDPHHPQQVSTVDDTHLKTWDLRASRTAFQRDNAHLFGVRDVDYNPNVPYQVLTTGEDAALRFWDLRHLQRCLRTLTTGHHHWVMRAKFNGHHDQLVLSCGTDSFVCLWRATSVASAPLGTGFRGGNESAASASGNAPTRPPDGLVKRFEEHEDACYGCCWSAADAWVFASVSYDGKLAINRVPSEEKYRILGFGS